MPRVVEAVVVDLSPGPGLGEACWVPEFYQRIWEGRELGGDECVISTDEKSQLQILSGRHTGRPPAPGGRPWKWRVSAVGHVAARVQEGVS